MQTDQNLDPPDTLAAPAPSYGQRLGLGGLCALLLALGLWTLRSFLPAIAWAVILGIACWPLYRRLERAPGFARHASLRAAAFTLAIALIVVVPLSLAAVQIGLEAHDWFAWLQQAQRTGIPVPNVVAHLPYGRQQVTEWWTANLSSPFKSSSLLAGIPHSGLVAVTGRYGQELVHRIVQFGFMLTTLFFLLQGGTLLTDEMLTAGRRAFGVRGERIAQRMVASVHGTVTGLVVVGIGEGVIMGIAYAIAHVPHPTLLGGLTAVAAMIPFCAPLVFAAVSLWLLASGATTAAIALFVAGIVVVMVAEHLVRPVLIGGSTRLPFLWVLFGILGGAETWGLIGLFVGPALMSALMLLWREWTFQPVTPPMAGVPRPSPYPNLSHPPSRSHR